MAHSGGERGIRTLDKLLGLYSLSRGAPSTTRPPLHKKRRQNSGLQLLGQTNIRF